MGLAMPMTDNHSRFLRTLLSVVTDLDELAHPTASGRAASTFRAPRKEQYWTLCCGIM